MILSKGKMKTFISDAKVKLDNKATQIHKTSVKKALKFKLNHEIIKVEAISGGNDTIVGSEANSLMSAIHDSFAHHKRLILSPDIIWLNIVQQVAIHIGKNPAKLQSKFVSFKGKKEIIVVRNDFRRGEDNPWENVFDEFSLKIKDNIGEKNHDNLTCDFSTTDIISKAAFNVAMMDAMQSYFDYRVMTMCGIPEITLQGNKEDWELLVSKAKNLSQYDLKWWIDKLIPVLQKFVDVFDDDIDPEYWRSFYKYHSMSGGDSIGGHCLNLFAYDKNGNRFFKSDAHMDDFTSGLSSVPFTWEYFGKEIKMKFISGFFGIEKDNESIKPYIGWTIVEL